MSEYPLFACTGVYRCMDYLFFVFLDFAATWTATLLWLFFFFQLFYFAQFAWWRMPWAWTVDVNSLRAAAVESYWKNQAQAVSISFKAHAQCSVCSELNKKCRAWLSFRPSQKHLISADCARARVKEGFNHWSALTHTDTRVLAGFLHPKGILMEVVPMSGLPPHTSVL